VTLTLTLTVTLTLILTLTLTLILTFILNLIGLYRLLSTGMGPTSDAFQAGLRAHLRHLALSLTLTLTLTLTGSLQAHDHRRILGERLAR